MKAHICVCDFGTRQQVEALNAKLAAHIFDGYINDEGTLVITMKADEVGAFFGKVSQNPELNWIEYRVQFEG